MLFSFTYLMAQLGWLEDTGPGRVIFSLSLSLASSLSAWPLKGSKICHLKIYHLGHKDHFELWTFKMQIQVELSALPLFA